MNRPIRTIRRSIRAAMRAGQQLVTAVRGSRFRVLVRLFAAIDAGRTVRIGYTDSKGAASVRDITPHRLDATAAGNITVRAFDWRDGEDTTFRADRMTLNAEENPVTKAELAVDEDFQNFLTEVRSAATGAFINGEIALADAVTITTAIDKARAPEAA